MRTSSGCCGGSCCELRKVVLEGACESLNGQDITLATMSTALIATRILQFKRLEPRGV